MERVGVDIVGLYPRSDEGNRYVLSAIDYFTKWLEAYAIPDQEAETIADALPHASSAPVPQGALTEEVEEAPGPLRRLCGVPLGRWTGRDYVSYGGEKKREKLYWGVGL